MALEQAGVQLIAQGVAGYVSDLQKADKATASVGATAMKAAGLTQDAAGRWRTATGQFATDAQKAAAGVAPLGSAAQKVGDTTEKAGKEVEQSGAHFKAFKEIAIGALREVGAMALQFGVQATKAIAGFVKDSISVAGDFEQGMHKFQAVAGDAVDTAGLEQFRDLFISLGKELPVSTSEVEQAAIEMVSGGIDPAIVAAGALRSTIQFAAASGLSLADAAATSAKFLAGWTSASASAADKVAFLTSSTDALTKAAAASSTTAAELRLGIFNVQGAAQALHAPFTDVVATLAELAPAFESSAQAGTALNVFMTRLVPQTDKAAGVMKDLGIITATGRNIFFDSTGAFLGLGNAAEVLKDKLSGMSDAQKIATLHELFGNDAMKVGNLLMQDGAAGLDAMKAKMDAANGVSATAALMQSGYNTALENAKGSAEALQITIGSFLLPVLTDLLNNVIAPGINTFTNWTDSIFKASDPLMALSQSIDTLIPGLGSIIGYITTFVTEGDSMNDFLTTTPPLFQALVSGIEQAIPTIQTLATFIGDNLTPILFGIGTAITVAVLPALVAAGAAFVAAAAPIAALVAAGALLYKAWTEDFGGIQEKTAAAWSFLQPILAAVVDWLQVNIPKAIAVVSDYWTGTLVPALKIAGAYFSDHIFPVLKDLTDIYIAAAIIEVKALATMWTDYLWPALKIVGSFISDVLAPIFTALFDVAFAIAKKEVEALAGLWQNVLWPALKSVGEYITTTIIPTFKSIGDYLSTTFGPTLKDIEKWLTDVTGGFEGVGSAVQDVVRYIEGLATSISTLKLPSWLTPGSPTPLETGLVGIGNALSKSVLPNLAPFQQGMREIGSAITDTFANTDIVDALESLGADALAGFANGMKNNMHVIIHAIDDVASGIEDAFQKATRTQSPSKMTEPIGEFFIQGFMVGMENMFPALKTLAAGLGDDLVGQVQSIAEAVQGAIADSFGATAGIDRQKVANLKATRGMTTGAGVQAQIDLEEKAALAMNDPQQAAAYFAMRSKQLIEMGKLSDEIAATNDAKERERLVAQYQLINAAQNAEAAQLKANQTARGSDTQDIIEKIQALLMNSKLPGILDDPIVAKLSGYLDQLRNATHRASGGPVAAGKPYWVGENGPELFMSKIAGQIMASQSQPATGFGSTSGTQNSYSQTTNLSMPIYTNQSPGVLQSSLAIAGAALP